MIEMLKYLKFKKIFPSVFRDLIQSWGGQGKDEVSLSASTLEAVRSCVGNRPCAVQKYTADGFVTLAERGLIASLDGKKRTEQNQALLRVVSTVSTQFEACPISFGELRSHEGLIHVPIQFESTLVGVLSVGGQKSELDQDDFIQTVECFASLLGLSFHMLESQEGTEKRERHLQSEVKAAMRELEQTNRRLIEKVRELKSLFGELENKVQELTKANKAKDEFLSIVSHELRTPLTSLNGFLSVLLDAEAGPINDDQKRFLTIAKQSADRLKLLISDLLDISRIESGRLTMEMGACMMDDLLLSSQEGMRASAAQKNIAILLEMEENLPQVWADPTRLQQVMDNLLTNAIKFTEPGGTVSVSACAKLNFVEITVTDTGHGFPPDQIEKVFDMFYQVDATAKRKAGGVGLGLAIARGIVSLHGGKIWAESEVGRGSTFRFSIPMMAIEKAA